MKEMVSTKGDSFTTKYAKSTKDLLSTEELFTTDYTDITDFLDLFISEKTEWEALGLWGIEIPAFAGMTKKGWLRATQIATSLRSSQ